MLEQRRTAPSDQLRLKRNGSATHARPHLSRRPLLAHSRSDFRHSWQHVRMCACAHGCARARALTLTSSFENDVHTNHERMHKDEHIHTSYQHTSITMHHTYKYMRTPNVHTCEYTYAYTHAHTPGEPSGDASIIMRSPHEQLAPHSGQHSVEAQIVTAAVNGGDAVLARDEVHFVFDLQRPTGVCVCVCVCVCACARARTCRCLCL